MVPARSRTGPGACFSKVPKGFRARKATAKSQTLWYTELFNSHILNINRGSLHTRSFRLVHLFVFKYRLTKNGFAGQISVRGFRETGPRSVLRHILWWVYVDTGPVRYRSTIFFSFETYCIQTFMNLSFSKNAAIVIIKSNLNCCVLWR